MIRHIFVLFALLVLVGGCAGYQNVSRQRFDTLPQHYTQFDADLAWQVKNLGSETVISGEFKNVRYQFMTDVEVWVAALDAGGKEIARSASLVIPHQLKQNDIAPFALKLPVAVAPGSKLRFTYNYTGSDGGDERGTYWTQSFLAVVPGGPQSPAPRGGGAGY